MTVTTKIAETKEVVREIEAPYYAMDGSLHYRINENGSVTKVFNLPTYFSIITVLPQDSYNKIEIASAINAKPSTHGEFMEAIESVREKMEKAMIN